VLLPLTSITVTAAFVNAFSIATVPFIALGVAFDVAGGVAGDVLPDVVEEPDPPPQAASAASSEAHTVSFASCALRILFIFAFQFEIFGLYGARLAPESNIGIFEAFL